jgi:UDP-glucose 4-epimerase
MRVLITGGSGFIGRNLKEQLTSDYDAVTPTSAELDLLDDAAVREYLRAERFDVVVHAATTRSNRRVTAPADMLDRNCRMFFNLVRNRDAFGKMIHFGSGAEYGPRGLLPLKVKEEFFDTHVPRDAYGFSKYVCAKWMENQVSGVRSQVLGSGSGSADGAEDIVELRLFAVFGPHEDYTVRFISNACARAVKGLPIVVRQDALFDYMYAKDLAPIVSWFLENDARHGAYNVCSGRPVALTELAKMVAQVGAQSRGANLHPIVSQVSAQRTRANLGHPPSISVAKAGMGEAYTGDNERLMEEMGGHTFSDMREAIAELYAWYEEHEKAIDGEALKFDEKGGR